jgi:hypothetical protein
MPFKKHNPGCPCCEIPSSSSSSVIPDCECGRGFGRTPTAKVTVDLPSSISWVRKQVGVSTVTWTRVTLIGLDAHNGTYFYPIDKIGFCLDAAFYSNDFKTASFTERREQQTAPVGTPCDVGAITTVEETRTITFSSIWEFSNFFAAGGIIISPGYFWYRVPNTNPTAGFLTCEDNYATKIFRPLIQRESIRSDECGFPADAAPDLAVDLYYYGSITMEMIDL